MWPRSKQGVVRYRHRLRQRECRLALERVRRRFPELGHRSNDDGPRVLEFGSGGGHQIPVLGEIGPLVATDVYISPSLKLPQRGCTFALADISRSPFRGGSFGFIFSNHVLEHIPELDLALDEIQRIGAEDCVYAFAVPTPLWLFLSLPAKYLDRTKRLFAKLARLLFGKKRVKDASHPRTQANASTNGGPRRSWRSFLLPQGHGEFAGFWEAVRGFRESAWRVRFARHSLVVVERHNLLLYATARWPIIPMNRFCARLGVASSRLFILQRAASVQNPSSTDSTG